jgi:hypothetical protein
MTDYCPPVSGTSTSGMPSSRNSWGVDVNRNDIVGTAWDGYSGASTTSCTSGTFAGPEPGSEPETKAVHWIVDTFPTIKFANDIHSYGGYFMWAPGAYKTTGRETLPQANIGVSDYFMAVAERVESRIKESRGTAMLPERTGVVVDVLYSAAGNSGDYLWYNKGIIGYDFEAGADIFTSTISGTVQTGVGFQPVYDPEGQAEAMEFASGNYGLLETALEYANDVTPPQAALVPDGGVSKAPIQATFKFVNEPSVIYYTLDGSTPTTASQTWEAQGPRMPGQVFEFDTTTTVKWIAKDIKGNISDVQTAQFVVTSPVLYLPLITQQ